eukprot:Platyproteum_vivax@DN7617_c1_g1_i5.p1
MTVVHSLSRFQNVLFWSSALNKLLLMPFEDISPARVFSATVRCVSQMFKESSQAVIELPEDDPDTFERFLQLAKLATSESKSFSPNVLFGDSKYGLTLLKNTYLLASKYDAGMVMKLLQNLDMAVPHKFQDVALLYELN